MENPNVVIPERQEVQIFRNNGDNISIFSASPECCDHDHPISIELQDVEKIVCALRRIKREILEGREK